MKSRLVVVLVILLSNFFTNGDKCGLRNQTINCVVSKNYAIKTFQGEFYSFHSNCSYNLLSLDGKSIQVDVGEKQVRISLDGKKYELKLSERKQVILETPTLVSLPYIDNKIEVIKPLRYVIAKLLHEGIKVKWNGIDILVIELDASKHESVSGLCSKNCGLQFSQDFVNEHKVSQKCFSNNTDTCKSVEKKLTSVRYCEDLLRNPSFRKCFNEIETASFLNECQIAHCNCKTSKYNSCMCDLIDSLAKHCEVTTGQSIVWRKRGFCEKICKSPLRYSECDKKQKSCGDLYSNTLDNTCYEGCVCPLNLWFYNGTCMPEAECPCRYENAEYLPGQIILQDCKTCECLNNNKWKCTNVMCFGEAEVYGDPHYTTFDGRRFDFMGKCAYYLVKGMDFAITADHYVLENGKFVKNFKSNAPSWTKVVEVTWGKDVITLKPNSVVLFNGKEIKKFPHKESNITISQPTGSKIIVELPNYMQVHWDGASTAKVRLPTTMRGYIQGLMGNFNKDPKDDLMLPDGTVTDDPNTFGHAWKVDGSCKDENKDPTPHPCENAPRHKPTAEKACSALKTSLFKDCKEHNADQSYESCLHDCCNAIKLGEKCACETIRAHADRCLNKTTNWRKEVPVCEIKCPSGQEYNYCLNPCESSCNYIALNPNCQKQCIEGCGCPSGQTMNEDKRCVSINECKCNLNGKIFPKGFVVLNDNKKKTCNKGKWDESPITDDDKKKYPSSESLEAKCGKNSNYSPCKSGDPITCQNTDNYKEEVSKSCKGGCECSDGFVLNHANGECVEPENCPCFFNGKSYAEQYERKTINEKCTCKSNKWECVKHENVNQRCSIFGNTSIRNLDGKVMFFESSCEYVLAKGLFNNREYMITIKKGKVTISTKDQNNQKKELKFNKDGSISPTAGIKMLDFDVTKVFNIEDIGIKAEWNRDGSLHLTFKPSEAKKILGLCGNLENPNNITDGLQSYIDTWNNDPLCIDLEIPKNENIFDINGNPAHTNCDYFKITTLKCADHLPVDQYYESCTTLEKKQKENDVKVFCQTLSTYAKDCKDIGTPIVLKAPDICPLECSGKKKYSQCIKSCTCDDIQTKGKCSEESCIEGCAEILCTKGNVYKDNSFSECVAMDECTEKTSEPTTLNNIATEEIPVIEPEGRSNTQEELIDAFYDVKSSLDKVNEPTIYETLSPKDKQMIETFTQHIEDFEDEITCYTNIVNKEMCKCFNGEQICGLNKNITNRFQNDHDVENNLELIKFMQSHLKCLENLKENPDKCTCISGKKVCPEKPVFVSTTSKPELLVYYYIIKCERVIVVSFYNLHFAKEGLNCLSHLDKDPTKNCRCEKGQMICSLQQKPTGNTRKPKEINKAVYNDYIDEVKKQLQCQAKIVNRKETCSCIKGKEVCSKKPEPIPEENTYDIVKQYKESPLNKTQLYDNYEKGLDCTEELGDETKVCTCMNGEKECFDMDFENPIEEPPADAPDPVNQILTDVEEVKPQILCLMKKQRTPQCIQQKLNDVDTSSDDILHLSVYLQYLRHVSEELICLRDKPSYCTCDLGRQKCSFDQAVIPNQNQKERNQVDVYKTFLDHIKNQLVCLSGLKNRGKGCFCDNGKEKCEENTTNLIHPLLDNNVLTEYDKKKVHPYIETQLECYKKVKDKHNKCYCVDGEANCETPEPLCPYIDCPPNTQMVKECEECCSKCIEKPQPLCPHIDCPPNTQMIKECGECCPKCVQEHCIVDIISENVMYKNVRKELWETWTEDNCRKCQCIKDIYGTHGYCTQPQCRIIPPEEMGRYKYVNTPGKCCPDIVPIGCEHNGKMYPANAVISKSLCETITCIRATNGKITKEIHRVTCNTTCDTGFVYEPSPSQCCGYCKALGCIFNGEIKGDGESWFSEDRCLKFRCAKHDDVWIISRSPKNCRPVNYCNGVIRIRDCCRYCDRTQLYF